eukprot:scaffold13626_cov110-Isochrysis_galbana.AAC.1
MPLSPSPACAAKRRPRRACCPCVRRLASLGGCGRRYLGSPLVLLPRDDSRGLFQREGLGEVAEVQHGDVEHLKRPAGVGRGATSCRMKPQSQCARMEGVKWASEGATGAGVPGRGTREKRRVGDRPNHSRPHRCIQRPSPNRKTVRGASATRLATGYDLGWVIDPGRIRLGLALARSEPPRDCLCCASRIRALRGARLAPSSPPWNGRRTPGERTDTRPTPGHASSAQSPPSPRGSSEGRAPSYRCRTKRRCARTAPVWAQPTRAQGGHKWDLKRLDGAGEVQHPGTTARLRRGRRGRECDGGSGAAAGQGGSGFGQCG